MHREPLGNGSFRLRSSLNISMPLLFKQTNIAVPVAKGERQVRADER